MAEGIIRIQVLLKGLPYRTIYDSLFTYIKKKLQSAENICLFIFLIQICMIALSETIFFHNRAESR